MHESSVDIEALNTLKSNKSKNLQNKYFISRKQTKNYKQIGKARRN